MAFDFKTATPETGIIDTNLLFGAPDFSSPNPAVYPVSTLRNLLLGGGNLAITAGKTLTVTETMTLTASGSSQTYTFPAAGGTVALLNAANIFSNAVNTFGVQGTTRGTVVLANTNGATNNLTLQSSNTNGAAWTFTFPIGAGTNSYALTTNGSGVTAWSQVDLTTAVTNTLPVGNGGTGRTTLTVHGVLLGNTTSGINATTAGSAGQVLVSGGASADPTWTTATFPVSATSVGTILRADGTNWVATTATYPATTTSQQLLYSSANNVIGGLSNTNGGIPNISDAGNISVTITPILGVQQTSRGTLTLANTAAGAYALTLQSSNSATAGYTLTLPPDAGAAGKPLIVTDSSGTGAWSKLILTQPATTATLTIADNKTVTVNNTLTFSGTDATTMTFPATTTVVAGLGITQTFTGVNTFTGNAVAQTGTTTMTDGFFYIPAASGAPTGVPTAYASRVPLYYDVSGEALYVYNGAWKKVSFLDNFLTQE
jgi:microcompartment protein CcmK/EutM